MELPSARPVVFESDGLKLEGELFLPDATPCPGVVVAHPHPQYGGDMRNNVVQALCRAALEAGAAALRFNFRGAGRSEGRFDNGAGEQRDVAGALEYLRGLVEVDAGRVALAGYSFGAAVALRLAPPDVRALIAVSAPTMGGMLSPPEVEYPVLLVSGDRDEYSDPELVRRAAAAIGPNAETAVLPGVGHFWAGSDERLREAVVGFLRRHVV